MLGQLNAIQIEQLLSHEVVGRIGCSDGNMVYVVPISYAYDGEYVYCHAREGQKIKIMRNHPDVCFEVDCLHDMANWQSVVTHGIFEELSGSESRNEALKRLHSRVLPLVSSETTHLSKDWPFEPGSPRFVQFAGHLNHSCPCWRCLNLKPDYCRATIAAPRE